MKTKDLVHLDNHQAKKLGYQFIIEGDECIIVSYGGNQRYINIPYTIDNFHVTSIGKNAFFRNHNIQKVVLPIYIKVVEEYAFSECKNLKEIYVPKSCEIIETNALNLSVSAVILTELSYVPKLWKGDIFGRSTNKWDHLVLGFFKNKGNQLLRIKLNQKYPIEVD
jgi:hypothetical protein